ncbi:hypothetical protein KFK09_026352 [Dendrobium nobile]|uniref:Pentatricopeptide repeat-containing protein n=1 Tax=Dendrobium nobile TaxID=94219 RepID=A0A8T3A6J7_DENNO|nr:hypothetical protein KFK09_026352 [Dendrobium nobile]
MISFASLQFFKKAHYFSTKSLIRTMPSSTCMQILEDCILFKNLPLGSQIHSKIMVSGFAYDSFLSTKLITLYSLCGDLSTALTIFELFPTCNVFLLNSMIRGYSSNGLYPEAISLFHRKRIEGLLPDSYTFSCVLKACALLLDLRQGENLHQLAVESGYDADTFVSNSLIFMYAKCSSLEEAVRVFDRMPQRDVVSWNSIISAYALNGFDLDAVETLSEMIENGLKPDQVTIISILTFCSTIDIVVREVHGFVLRNGVETAAPMIQNALISAYGKCGMTEGAQRIFNGLVWKDKVTWNALIASFAQNGLFEESLQLLRHMKVCRLDLDVVTYSGIISSLTQTSLSNEAMMVFDELLNAGLKPDVVAIASVLPSISGLDYCKQTHGYSFRHGLETDRRVRNALVSVYSKCGSIQYAKQVFEAIRDRDVISWSSLVVGYSQNLYFVESLETFREMMLAEMEPNPVTITSALSACAGASGLRLGKELHLWAIKNSFEGQAFVGSALIDMYAKCGRIKNSRTVFDLMDDRNLVSWNSMIGGYAIHGLAHNALEIFEMVTKPDDVSFIAALSACSHGGLVEEGIAIFSRMKEFKLTPRESHYACMVDLLARSGRIEQALALVRTIMPAQASVEIWGVLLGACKVHSNLEIGVYTGEQIIESGSANSGYYVLFSNVLANFERWGDVEEMRRRMKEKGVRKGSGFSWIEVNKRVHSFVAKDRTHHPEWESLFKVLKFLGEQMKGMYC